MTNLVQVDQRILTTTEIQDPAGGVLVIPNDGVPTQVANPGRAALRTFVAVVVGLVLALPTINGILLAVQQTLQEQTDFVIPGWVWLVINGALAAIAIVTTLITRLLAIPGVNSWIRAHIPSLAAIPIQIRRDS